MIICLFLFILAFSPSLSQSIDCSKCLYGCENGTSVCVNSTCVPCIFNNCNQYYGNTCSQKAPSAPNTISLKFLNTTNPNGSCNGTASVLPFDTSLNYNTLNPKNYYLVYGTDSALGNSDPNLNTTNSLLMTYNSITKTYDKILQFNGSAFYRFATYFTFEDINLYGEFTSSISTALRTFIMASNCSVITTLPTTSTISPSTTTIASTTTTIASTTTVQSNFSVQIVTIQTNFTFIYVQWNPPKTTTGLSNYVVTINPGSAVTVNLNINSYNFTNLNEGTLYTLKITSNYAGYTYDTQISSTTLQSNPPVNLSWNKDYTYGMVYWNLTNIIADYYFTISVNNTKSGKVSSNVLQYNVTNLNESGSYLITVAVYYYGGREVNNSIIVWTKPAKFNNSLDLPRITNITSKTFEVLFPPYSNYKGDINLYYILLQSSTTTSRRKREVVSCQAVIPGIPSSATIRFANTSNNNKTILIGSGTPYSPFNCINDNLLVNTNYTVYAVIGSLVNGSAEYVYSITTFQTTSVGLSAIAIVGIILGVLLFLIILIVLLVLLFRYKRKKSGFFNFKVPHDDIRPQSYLYWTNITDRMEPRKLVIDEKKIFEGLTFKDEYDCLPAHPCNENYGIELDHLNDCRDHTGDHIINYGSENTHYNAYFVDGYFKKKAYLSLPTPFDENNISNFWLMIYTENVGQIVMITTEGELNKNNKYWPDETTVYDEIEVSFVDDRTYAYFSIRTFDISKIDSNRKFKVNQYHYWKWPVNDNLVNIASFLEFHEVIKRSENLIFGATTVHSQLGRSLNGLYIGFDILCDQLHTVDSVNVYREFGQLSRYNQNMNININQYMIVHDLLFESYLSSRFVIDVKFKQLMNSSQNAFPNFLERQFHLLKKFFGWSLSNEIKKDNNYIFDSVECSQSIILSNSLRPFIEESIALWDMIFSNNINIIVDLYNRDLNEMFYISQNLRNIEILDKTLEKHKNHVNCVQITVKHLYNNEIRKLVIYSVSLKSILEYNIGGYSTWIELISNIINRPKNNLLVFNNDQSFTSTVFIVCLNAATKLLYSKFVSVYYTIRSLQSSGHSIINNFEEFKFIFEFLEKWIKKKISKDDYDPEFSFNLESTQEKSLESGAYNRLYPNLDNFRSSFKSSDKYLINS